MYYGGIQDIGASPQTLAIPRLAIMVNLLVIVFAFIVSSQAIVRSGIPDDMINTVVCQGERLYIRCPNSSFALNIHGGSYGRTQSGHVICQYPDSDQDMNFNCGENDVTTKLRKTCQKRKKCSFRVGKMLFGDPCGGKHVYLSVIYSCVKRKKRRKPKLITAPTIASHSTTLTTRKRTEIRPTTARVMAYRNSTQHQATIGGSVTDGAATFATPKVDLSGYVVLRKRARDRPGVFISIIMWFLYVKENLSSFLKVFLISMVAATAFFSLIFGFFAVRSYLHTKQKEKEAQLEGGTMSAKLNTSSGDIRKHELDRLSPHFPSPPPALAPLPDDIMYPSPSYTLTTCTKPPPPPQRGYSVDDMSKMVRDSTKFRSIPVTRSISLRSKENYEKELKFDRLPDVDCYRDIQAVIIQRNNGSTMYMNPMYENGVLIKEAAKC